MEKWLKWQENRRTNGGFTLIEVITASAVFAIFSLTVATLLMPMLNSYVNAIELANMNIVASNIGDVISNEIAMAKVVKVADDKKSIAIVNADAQKVILQTTQGALMRTVNDKDAGAVFAGDTEGQNGFYKQNAVTVTFDGDKGVYSAEIFVEKTGKNRDISTTRTISIKQITPTA